eukprot:scaffold116758_cov24-Tisochrysis_lutea.AAC.1
MAAAWAWARSEAEDVASAAATNGPNATCYRRSRGRCSRAGDGIDSCQLSRASAGWAPSEVDGSASRTRFPYSQKSPTPSS